ncbi:acetylcholine receptor subunit alpha-1-A [Eurytemora carolleeae]|uniref:acetylcholine receptor subunit alpha-1-A n=1 Tax=Eurytemora carolleeae TaxID=1294199 RepID=UPI000C7776F3|nr:acetylcholine receptor subunit alpha-1-A [Eurytemora carolleeae]|eukprot:XP_023322147.1 acetylcholine receptor subunit alpha-1-A-like [Eurytemora affinis]
MFRFAVIRLLVFLLVSILYSDVCCLESTGMREGEDDKDISRSQDTGVQRNKENKVQNISMGRSKKGTLNIAQEGLRSTPGDPEKGKDGIRLNSTQGDPEKGGTGRGRPEQEESRLLNYLMSTYDREVRPVYNASHAVEVRVGITLTQIFDMDEKNQVLTTNIWLDQEWEDQLLTWNPEQFNGIEKMLIPCDKIWLPDIVLYNSADDYSQTYFRSLAAIDHAGNVFWPPPTKFRSTCPVDVKYFPFDDQTCNLKLSSWMYDGTKLNVMNRTSNIDLENYVPNGEWELLEARLVRTEQYYPCCIEPYPSMTVTIRIRRKTLYYMYNIVFPCMMMSSLTVLVFCLPPDSGEKIALGVTVILAFSVFMLAIAEKMPETSESIPLVGIYLTFVMAMTTVSVIMTVIVLNFFYRGPALYPVPHWAKKFIMSKGTLSSPSFMFKAQVDASGRQGASRPGGTRRNWQNFTTRYNLDILKDHLLRATRRDESNGTIPSSPRLSSLQLQLPRARSIEVETLPFMDAQPNSSNNIHGQNHQEQDDVKGILAPDEDLYKVLKLLLEKEDQQNKDDLIRREWRMLAEIIDKWLFWGFFLITTLSTAIFIVILPYGKRGKFF